MTKVAILPEPTTEGDVVYRAVAGARQSVAKTAGAALDALTAQLPAGETGTLVIVQNLQPDELFTEPMQQRLAELMEHWRAARDSGLTLPPAEQEELEALVEVEVKVAGMRAAMALRELGQ